METESSLSTFTAGDGENLAVQDWPLEPGQAMRGVVLLVHGLGEHAGRYEGLAARLNDWGFGVRGYDHYGHGDSGGPRGGLSSDNRLLDDLADVVEATRVRMPRSLPLVLLGHSLGGLVAAHFVAQRRAPVEALVLSSPALDAGLSTFQKMLIAVLPRLLPDLRVSNGLKPHYLSHDPRVVSAYRSDRRCHDRVSARLARYIAEAGPTTLAAAPRWTVPTLLMYAGDDRLVNPAGSRAFAAAAPACVQSRCFEALYHELFNELAPEPVYGCLADWLDARFGRPPQLAA